MRRRPPRALAVGTLAGLAPGCSGIQSALSPTGGEAQAVVALFWTATAISVAVTAMVVVLLGVAMWAPSGWRRALSRERVIIAGGLALPVVVLTGVLGYGLLVMQAGAARSARADGPAVTVTGKRWWWEVVYEGPDGERVVSANELRLPVGEPVAIRLESDNVIHSFWVPQLAGKLDMIPGRTNVLTLEAREAGVSRGQCAEYCGGAHALMSFYVETMPPDAYAAWLAREAEPAREPQSEVEIAGRALFLSYGCGACHTVRGTAASGTVAPDLTHVGGRRSLAAAALPNDAEAFARWIRDNQHVKPENLMPAYEMFTPDQLAALAAYLESLE